MDNIAFYPYLNEVNTSIGSSLNGQNKFEGLLKAFRIWTSARTEAELSQFRYFAYTSTPASLVASFKLNSNNELYGVRDSVSGKFLSDKSLIGTSPLL
jgi:hypothetical protein